MRFITSFAVIAAMAAGTTQALAQAAEPERDDSVRMARADGHSGPGRRGADHHRRGGDHRRGGERLLDLIETYDADADGAITQAEVDAARAERHGSFDADADGALSLEEYQALWLDAMRERMVDRFQQHDEDGDGLVTAEEFSQAQARMVRRLDSNDDGVINEDDMRRGRRAR